MPTDQSHPSPENAGRRGFLKGSALGVAALATTPAAVQAQPTPSTGTPPPSDATLARETGTATPAPLPSIIVEHPQSDFMVDIFKSLGLEYIAANPGSSFDSLQESVINYGDNSAPEFLTCCHEESAVAMAHGYAKIEGKPMGVFMHGTIGIQHASMAMYNAYSDRVPIYMVAGLGRDAVRAHAATDMAAPVRDFVKWDYQPRTLDEFANTAVQAWRFTSTPPTAPVLLVVDLEMQMAPQPAQLPRIPPAVLPQPPATSPEAAREIARALLDAENPRINCGRVARSQEGIDLMVELAELLQVPVNAGGDRMNFPLRHPLAGNGTGEADLVLNLETNGAGGGRAKQITLTTAELLLTGNYDMPPGANMGDLAVAADAQASLPALIEAVRSAMTAAQRRRIADRGRGIGEAHKDARVAAMQRATIGWDSSPVSVPRLCAELWDLLKNEDWSLVSPQGFISSWPSLMWDMRKHYHHIGSQGAGGVGYGAPASVGAALANRKHGRLSVNIQTDGDLCYSPTVLWTAAHHRIPLLTVMHNNRAYHQETMFMQRMANWHNRRADRAHIGTAISDPNIDYAMMARSFGLYAEGPITNPNDLRGALQRGIEQVKRGEPVLIDVVTQPR
jgi:thiamine pyrophosphate-dependent acetolactate synthase large subunit-like protein